MPLMEKQQQLKGSRRPGYAVFRKRRRMGGLALLILLLLLALIGLGAYLFSDSLQQQTSKEPQEHQQEQQQKEDQEEQEEEAASEQQQEKEEEEEPAPPPPPEDPTLFLTVPKLGLYNHTVRNDRSEWALDLGAIKLPSTGFPWEKADTNTYIACHRIGWPGTESYNQCLNLPLMQKGD